MNGPQRRVLLPSLASPLVNQLPHHQPASISAQAARLASGEWVIDFIGPSGLRWTLQPVDAMAASSAFALAVHDYLSLNDASAPSVLRTPSRPDTAS
jgi:hypothetical protein